MVFGRFVFQLIKFKPKSMSSNAVGSELVSQVVGYKITKGNFNETTPNLPQRVAIFGEANTANQTNLSTDPIEITTAQQAGQLFGYGSPIYHAMRILRPVNGGGIGGIPTIVYPQLAAVSATSHIIETTVTGNATGNGTHTVVISGRKGVDSVFYDFQIVTGDTPTIIAGKIVSSVNNVLGAPVIASNTAGVVSFETKWAGLTSAGLTISIDNNNVGALGVTYASVIDTPGTGTPSIADSLAKIQNDWVTVLVNCYGLQSTIVSSLQAFNGIPDPANPTGRYSAIIMKPFVAFSGFLVSDATATTNALLNDVTIATAPAPNSTGFQFEAAANMAVLYARQAQDNPHLDVSEMTYPDMPTPLSIGTMGDYVTRDSYLKKGSSTVDLLTGRFQVKDFVTTYHPVGETPPQFRYVRNLNIDFNIRFGYYLLEQINVIGHAIANDNDIVSASKVIKPKQWKAILFNYADDLARRGLIVDAQFMKDSIVVNISSTNPDRFETFFRYKRSGFVRIASTTAEAGFNFGSNNN